MTPELCQQCQSYASRYLRGAEIELTMLFADVRGSTTLAERMSAAEFSQLISHFFAVASDLLMRSHALVDRLVGDQVIGRYVPGFAGPDHGGWRSRRLRRYCVQRATANPTVLGFRSELAFIPALLTWAPSAPRARQPTLRFSATPPTRPPGFLPQPRPARF
ncbi:MAG TPA: hypothetical protein VF177_08395 [Anaerolineae bacterium]